MVRINMPADELVTDEPHHTIDFLNDVPQRLVVEVARTRIPLRDIINWRNRSVITFPKLIGEPVEVLIDEQVIARGEVVVINDHFGVRITEITHPSDKPSALRHYH
jgi:flagellar motor switch protein FliN/FliY